MLIVFKNGKELRVPKEVVDDITRRIDENKDKKLEKLWHLVLHSDGSTAIIISVFDISFIVDDKLVKEGLEKYVQ
jgi:hypothetical protein